MKTHTCETCGVTSTACDGCGEPFRRTVDGYQLPQPLGSQNAAYPALLCPGCLAQLVAFVDGMTGSEIALSYAHLLPKHTPEPAT